MTVAAQGAADHFGIGAVLDCDAESDRGITCVGVGG